MTWIAPACAMATVAPYRVSGTELLLPETARALRDGETLILRRWQGSSAVLKRPVYLEAAPYRFLRVRITGLEPSQRAFVGWKARTVDGASIVGETLPWTSHNTVTIELPDSWRGTITELALGVNGRAKQDLTIHELELLPPGTGARLSALMDRWLNVSLWTLRDINNLPGTTPDRLLSPVAAGTAVATIAFILIMLGCRARRASPRRAVLMLATTLACLWLALDGLWQRRLLLQLAETRDTFAGLKGEERSRADLDAALYRLAKQIAPGLPASPGDRIFLLHEAYRHNMQRLRLQYHLLPRNIFNFGRKLPDPGSFRQGDRIILLGEVPGVRFDEQRGALVDEQRTLPASPIAAEGPARVYRIEESGEGLAP